MSTFRTGRLANPVKVIKTSPSPILLGNMSSAGPFERVYLKLTPVNIRCIESVCSWLAVQVGLPTPHPCLITAARNRIPRDCSWPLGSEDAGLFFGTIEVDGAQQLVRVPAALEAGLHKWPHLEMAAVFDQLVANDDRTAGNILVSPSLDLILIDHARSLGGGGQRLFSTQITPLVQNYFLNMIAREALGPRSSRRNTLIACCIKISGLVTQIPYAELHIPEDHAFLIKDFLGRRASMLQTMILDAVGLPDLYQSHQSSSGLQ